MNRRFSPSIAISAILLLAVSLYGQSGKIPSPFVTGQAAHNVLGQVNFSDITFGTTQTRWGAISGIAIAGNKFVVVDSSYLAPPNNNRVLIFSDLKAVRNRSRFPDDDLLPSDVVLGQPDFTTSTSGTSSSKFNQPVGIASDGTRLFISEWGNNRVLIYNRVPEISGASADVVVGQKDFASSGFGAGNAGLRRPNGVSTDGTRLFIADTLNNRILIFSRIPTANGASADIVLGQPDFNSTRALATSIGSMSSPMSVTTDGQRLIVSDLGNNRVLIYNSIPTQSGAQPSVIVGQPDFTSNAPGSTGHSLNFPRYAYSDGTRLVIVDSGNNRLLVYNQIPTQNGTDADVVIGQSDFLGFTESCASSNFAIPFAIASDGDTMYVSDSFNRRVLGFRPGASLISASGVVNGASYSKTPQTEACKVTLEQPPVAPGSLAAVFGDNLADSNLKANSLPLPTSLGGVRVKINGYDAPIASVSPTQLNVQVPFEVTGYSASVEIEKDTPAGKIVTAAAPIGIADGAPGLFSRDGSGNGLGMITHGDGTPVNSDSPAKPGETLTAIVTGLGNVTQKVPNGDAALFGAMGGITIGGTPTAGNSVTVVVQGIPYSYTTVSGDSLDQVTQNLTTTIDQNDPNVSATADIANEKINLVARVRGDVGTNITYNAFAPAGSTLTATVDSPIIVPGDITFSGTPASGQIISVTLQGTVYTYTPVNADTTASVINKLVDIINADPNVVASADIANRKLHLELRNPGAIGPINYTALVEPAGSALSALADEPHLTPGVSTVVNTVTATLGKTLYKLPGTIQFAGTVEAGQTITVTLQDTKYSYTTLPEDTLQTVLTKVTTLLNGDPNVTATSSSSTATISLALKNSGLSVTLQAETSDLKLIAFASSTTTTNSTTATITFAGLVPGTVGLYQVNFTVPTTQTADSALSLSLYQNLIVFGSVTTTNIFSNYVTFPVQP